jgi:protein-disulfide isomerase
MSGSRRPRSGVPNRDSGAPAGTGRPRPDRGGLSRSGTQGSDTSRLPSIVLWSAVAVLAGGLVIGLALFATRPNGGGGGGDSSVRPPSVVTSANIRVDGTTLGLASAPVTIDLYGDFRCSGCLWFTVTGNVERQVVDKYVATGQARLVWHNFVLIDKADGTTASRDAANAALCAADQGKFWVMHDWLYANQLPGEVASAFSQDRLLAIGQAAGMDMTTFRPCVQQGKHNDQVEAEKNAAAGKVDATPAIFVNGKMVDAGGFVPNFSQVSQVIDAALKG